MAVKDQFFKYLCDITLNGNWSVIRNNAWILTCHRYIYRTVDVFN